METFQNHLHSLIFWFGISLWKILASKEKVWIEGGGAFAWLFAFMAPLRILMMMRDWSYRVASTIPKEANEGQAHNAVEPRIQMPTITIFAYSRVYKPKHWQK